MIESNIDVAHWVRHGDQNCERCVRGMRLWVQHIRKMPKKETVSG